MPLPFVANIVMSLCALLGLIYFFQALTGREGAWRRFAMTAAICFVALCFALPPNSVAGTIAVFALILGLIYFVQALRKQKGAWRGFAVTAAVYLVTSSAAYLLTSPEQRAEILARRAAAEQQK